METEQGRNKNSEDTREQSSGAE